MSNPILLAPGPVQLHPEVQKILAEPMIHHRTPAFDDILAQVFLKLKFLFQTTEPVFLHTATGSGAMESSLVNILSPGDEVLSIVSGKFGERWADMAETFGARVHRMNCQWGESASPDEVAKYLKDHPQTKIVLTQACETSTGAVHDIQKLGQIIKETKALLVVDGITAVGAFPMPMDAWNIDVLVAGSQKAVMLPTGLSFVSFSKKAWASVLTAKTPRYYFDVRLELKANQNGETLFSSAVPLVKALNFVLTNIQKKGLAQHFKEIKRRADFTRALTQSLGLKLFSKAPSDSVTSILLPDGFDGAKLRLQLEKKYLMTVAGGQDQLKGKIIRIGHMGFITDLDLSQTATRLAEGLHDQGFAVDAVAIEAKAFRWLKENPL